MSTRLDLAAALLWRAFWAAEDRVRAMVWGDRLGFDLKNRPTGEVARMEQQVKLAAPRSVRAPRSHRMGAFGSSRPESLLGEIGRFYGLDVQADSGASTQLLEMAVGESWPLVALDVAGAGAVSERSGQLLKAYVERGGTLFVHGIDMASADAVGALSISLGRPLPAPQSPLAGPSEISFSPDATSFAQDFAGVSMPLPRAPAALRDAGGVRALAWARTGGRGAPAVCEVRAGQGRVVMSTGTGSASSLGAALEPLQPLAALPPMMAVRQAYGDVAWHAARRYANFVVDDPALRNGRLGLDYPRTLELAREHGFHLTVATIPRELSLAEPQVVELLRRNSRWLSACYHGSDHAGYEFYLSEGRRMRYRNRSVPVQERALRRAVERGEEFAARTGLALDRVMVFPFGVGSAAALNALQSLGFLAACNFDDRYPLGASLPDDFDLGMRPADLGWSGFPLIWRRGLPDPMFVLDLFLGRPAITFAHPKAQGADLEAFTARAQDIGRVADVRWASLEEIARHSYLERRDPKHGWQVAMMSNEICVHNPDPRPRRYTVTRAHLPIGYTLSARQFTVEAGGARVVRVTSPLAGSLHPGVECSIAEHRTVHRMSETSQDKRPTHAADVSNSTIDALV